VVLHSYLLGRFFDCFLSVETLTFAVIKKLETIPIGKASLCLNAGDVNGRDRVAPGRVPKGEEGDLHLGDLKEDNT
jgi:hypothetical protein